MTCGEGMESRYLGRGLPCSAIQCVGAAFLTAHPPMGANSSRHLGEGQLLPPRGPAASVLPIHCQVRSHAQLPNTVSGQSQPLTGPGTTWEYTFGLWTALCQRTPTRIGFPLRETQGPLGDSISVWTGFPTPLAAQS